MANKLIKLEALRALAVRVQSELADTVKAVSDAISEVADAKADRAELDDMAQMLASGELRYTLTTSDGKAICTSSGSPLTANKKL